MPRPEKFDRVKKLVAFETGYYPLAVTQKKNTLTVTFASDVPEQEIPTLQEKLTHCIPFDVVVTIKGDD